MKKLTANWGLKLASLIFAMVVWFLVTNINDPVTSVRYTNVPVTLKNTNLITDQGQVYTILDNSDTISSVTLYAPRSIIDSLSQNNLVATADIQDISSLNTVKIDVVTNKYYDKIENIVTSSEVVKLSVERKAAKSLALSATTSGSLADGYVIGDVSTEQNMVRINGPESIVNQVASASVDVDVTGFTSNIGTDADIILLDAEGNTVDSSQVTMNIKTVRVNVVIYETKYVPISYSVTGEPAAGYMLTGEIDSAPDTVLIAGRNTAISQVSEIKVEDENINVTGLSSDLTYTYNLEKFLPSGIYLGDPDFNGAVAVVVHVSPVETQVFDVNISNISVDGEVQGYKVYVDDSEYETVSLTLQGLKENVRKVSAGSLKGAVSVDDILSSEGLEELKEGTYSADVDWALPEGVTAKGTVSVYVTVEKDS
jgi:YbbR domain-containing protein